MESAKAVVLRTAHIPNAENPGIRTGRKRQPAGHCLRTAGGGGGCLGPWPAPANPPTHPHQKNFPPAKK